MRHVAATVYAVTTGHGGNRFGILATAVSSLSFDPPSVLVCVNRSASLHGPLASAETFCVNVLGLGLPAVYGVVALALVGFGTLLMVALYRGAWRPVRSDGGRGRPRTA